MDSIDEWTRAQQRVIALVRDLAPEAAARRVPACPGWTVRELLSHMVGLGADVVDGDEPDGHNAAWTQAQVDARAGRDVTALVTEWESLTAPLQSWMRANGPRPLGDVLIHEQDLRGALGVPGARDTDGLQSLRPRFLDRFATAVAGLPPIALAGGSWTWVSAGSADDAAVVVRASDFDLIRALVSRRSERQLRSWVTRGDLAPYLPAFSSLGELPSTDLDD